MLEFESKTQIETINLITQLNLTKAFGMDESKNTKDSNSFVIFELKKEPDGIFRFSSLMDDNDNINQVCMNELRSRLEFVFFQKFKMKKWWELMSDDNRDKDDGL